MDNKIKNSLGIVIAISVLALGYSAIIFAIYFSKSIQPSSFRSFAVSGEGKEIAVPNIAQFTFDIITEGGKDLALLQKDNTTKTNKAIEFIKSNGIDVKDIQTQNYNVSPRYQYFSCPGGIITPNQAPRPCPPPEIVGYTITQTISVKIRNFEKIGSILSGVVSNGANSVSQLNFTIDDPTSVQNIAREKAIQKAKEKAESIAKAGGFQLGRLLAIDEGGSTPIPIFKASGIQTMESVPTPAPIIEPGSQETIVNITLHYEIE